MFAALFSYSAWGKKSGRSGLIDDELDKPLLLNIPKDGTDPFLGTNR